MGHVVIRSSDVSVHHTPCATGFLIPPFNVPTTIDGAGVLVGDGLQHGWAGITVDVLPVAPAQCG